MYVANILFYIIGTECYSIPFDMDESGIYIHLRY